MDEELAVIYTIGFLSYLNILANIWLQGLRKIMKHLSEDIQFMDRDSSP